VHRQILPLIQKTRFMVAIAKSFEKEYSLAEYLTREEKAVHKHEFYNGKIVKRASKKYWHNLVTANLIFGLGRNAKYYPNRLRVLNSNQKIYIPANNFGVYPDALVICEPPVFWENREDLITNPLLIVEVLSRNTAEFDRTGKFFLYQELASFQEYVLIDPREMLVESWFKMSATTWDKSKRTEIQQSIELRSIGVTLSLSDIYDGVVFPPKKVKKNNNK
jgi:Uma2 family endonuclease